MLVIPPDVVERVLDEARRMVATLATQPQTPVDREAVEERLKRLARLYADCCRTRSMSASATR